MKACPQLLKIYHVQKQILSYMVNLAIISWYITIIGKFAEMLNSVKSRTSDLKEQSNKENFHSNGKQLPSLVGLNSPPKKEVQPFILITPESKNISY